MKKIETERDEVNDEANEAVGIASPDFQKRVLSQNLISIVAFPP
jgi:hypothetical protein